MALLFIAWMTVMGGIFGLVVQLAKWGWARGKVGKGIVIALAVTFIPIPIGPVIGPVGGLLGWIWKEGLVLSARGKALAFSFLNDDVHSMLDTQLVGDVNVALALAAVAGAGLSGAVQAVLLKHEDAIGDLAGDVRRGWAALRSRYWS